MGAEGWSVTNTFTMGGISIPNQRAFGETHQAPAGTYFVSIY